MPSPSLHKLFRIATRRSSPRSSARKATLQVEALEDRTTPALVAAYSFSEGTGTTVADLSGNGNGGTIANATWTAGQSGHGGALSFNGTNARVNVDDSASLHLTAAMTLEA